MSWATMELKMQNKLRFIRRVLYRLKRSYGISVYLYKIDSVTDYDTGNITETYTNVKINKALAEPTREVRSFVYDLAYISANKDFTMGGFFDTSDRIVVLDSKDIPSTWGEIDNNQFLMIQNQRFDIKEVQEYENNSAIVLVCRMTKGAYLTHLINVISVMSLDQAISYVKS